MVNEKRSEKKIQKRNFMQKEKMLQEELELLENIMDEIKTLYEQLEKFDSKEKKVVETLRSLKNVIGIYEDTGEYEKKGTLNSLLKKAQKTLRYLNQDNDYDDEII